MAADDERILNGEEPATESVNKVRDVPAKFNDWIEHNKERAKGWANMPHFIRDNPHYVKGFEVDTYTPAERKFTRARKTSPAMAESLDTFLQRKYPELPNTEKAAIFHFTRGDVSAYRQLNKQHRKGNLSEFNQAFSELLSSGLLKLPPIEGVFYRTVRLNKTTYNEWVKMANNKSRITFNGFTSTSLDRSIAEQFAVAHTGKKKNETDVLLVINGKSGRLIQDLSQFGGRFDGKSNQKEVLFDKNTDCRFDKVDKINGNTIFYLTEL